MAPGVDSGIKGRRSITQEPSLPHQRAFGNEDRVLKTLTVRKRDPLKWAINYLSRPDRKRRMDVMGGGVLIPIKEIIAYDMKWTAPQYERLEVNAAGGCLIADSNGNLAMHHDRMLEIINNWRSAHSLPLQIIKMNLLNRAKKIDKRAIIAQRLKRLSSIGAKLDKHKSWMKLTQMQDIGGCRAIVENIHRVKRLIKSYDISTAKNPKRGHVLNKLNNYIADPKEDGYRSYHLVYRYRSVAEKHQIYNDMKIEIQLRSRLQHAWATASETVGTFSEQPLKSGGGKQEWRRFFALMGSAIALREKCPMVPGTPSDKDEVVRELRELNNRLNVEAVLKGWNASLEIVKSKSVPNAVAYLLEIDPVAYKVVYQGFTTEEADQASQLYLQREKDIAVNPVPGAQAVLASVTSLQALRIAFPNYYLDTRVFIEAMNEAIK